jgi:hypothetical protein
MPLNTEMGWLFCSSTRHLSGQLLEFGNDSQTIGAVIDLKSMKQVIEGVKRADLNNRLPLGFHLTQEIETRFHLHDVASRLSKAPPYVFELVTSGISPSSVQDAMESITPVQCRTFEDSSRLITPRLEAIIDVLAPVVDAMIKLQASQSPTSLIVLPHRELHIR